MPLAASASSLRRTLLDRVGIVPGLLVGLVTAIVLSVLLVEFWSSGSIAESVRQQTGKSLSVSLSVLKLALAPLGEGPARGFEGDGVGTLSYGGVSLAGRNDLVDEVKAATGATATIFAGQTRIATTVPKPDGSRATGTKLAPGPALTALQSGQTYRGENVILGKTYATIYEPIRGADGRALGVLYVGVPTEAITADAHRLLRGGLLTGLAGGVVIALIGWRVLRRIVRPLTGLAHEMRAIAGGALDRAVPYTARRDQIGTMAVALQQLRDSARAAEAAAAEAAEARGRVAADKQALLGRMAATIEHETAAALAAVQRGSADMTGLADDIAATAERSGSTVGEAARAAGDALATAQSVAGATEELTRAIHEISVQISQSSTIVSGAVTTGRDARRVFEELTTQVSRVGAVAGMIADIAGRTNLLALNAAIEAARAGEAGRGFAVVAAEVKALATQTARSTEEIASHIAEVRAATDHAAAAMSRIESSIGSMDGIATVIAAAVEQQGAATSAIAQHVAGTERAARDAAARIGDVSNDIARTTAQAGRVHGHADALLQQVAALRDTVRHAIAGSTAPGGGGDASVPGPVAGSVRHAVPATARAA